MMKKIVGCLLSLMLICSLAACGGDASAEDSPQEEANQTETEQQEEAQPEEQEADSDSAGGKTLVVYYSATGNTKAVAETIASATGGDLFEIVPTEVYTDEDLDWTNEDSRVSREHDDESLRDVELTETAVPDWESYDTVFIGYPIWWGIAAWPTDSFVKANDFTGKTVVPFCTSSTSGLGQSGELLEEEAGTGDWMEGERFSSGASEDEISEWVESL